MTLGRMLHTDGVTSHRITEGKRTACGKQAWRVFEGNPDLEVRCKRCFPKAGK